MPAAQVISSIPQYEKNPVQENLEQFFTKLGKDYRDKQDQVEIGKIISQYDQSQKKASDFQNLISSTEKSPMSPSKKVDLINKYKIGQEAALEEIKALNTQTALSAAQAKVKNTKEEKDAKAAEKTAKTKDEVKEILISGGESPEEAERLSDKLSVTSANERVKMKKGGEEYSKLREKSISDYVNNTFEEREQSQNLKTAITQARKAIQGEVTGPGWNAVLKSNPYTQLMIGLTPDEAVLQAANKSLLEGTKGLFGSKPTEREIFLLLSEMLPAIGKTPEANEAGLGFIEKVNNMKLARADIVDRLTNGGSKFVPNLEQQVNEQLAPVRDALRAELEEAVQKYAPAGGNKKNGDKGIRVTAPNGKLYDMTQQQIDDARKQGVIFEPVKK